MYIYAIYLAVASVLTFFTYVADKTKARNGSWRVPEKVLLGMSFLGGAVGGIIAMRLVRHKTKHWYFHAVNALGVLWQIGLLAFLLFK